MVGKFPNLTLGSYLKLLFYRRLGQGEGEASQPQALSFQKGAQRASLWVRRATTERTPFSPARRTLSAPLCAARSWTSLACAPLEPINSRLSTAHFWVFFLFRLPVRNPPVFGVKLDIRIYLELLACFCRFRTWPFFVN